MKQSEQENLGDLTEQFGDRFNAGIPPQILRSKSPEELSEILKSALKSGKLPDWYHKSERPADGPLVGETKY